MKHIGRVLTLIALALLGIGALPAAAQESILYSFGGVSSDPSEPNAGLILDAKGNLYGTSQYGGVNGNGAVFELSPKEGGGWTETVLWSFNQGTEGGQPLGSLVFDKDGNLYGTLEYGGLNGGGSVFELSPGAGEVWTLKLLYSFDQSNGNGESGPANPYANLIFDSDGNLYGTTDAGGLDSWGTVFELSPSTGGEWTLNVLHTFYTGPNASNDGQFPHDGLIFDSEGNLYGTTSGGGANGSVYGTVFELSPAGGGNWTEKVLWSFNTPSNGDATHPAAGLVFDAQGNLYGTGSQGGNTGNLGAVFELSPGTGGAWTEKVLWNFTGGPSDGASPYSTLVLDAQGNLYGTTSYGGADGYAFNNGYPAYAGTVFELSPTNGAWTETILHNFGAPSTDGLFPYDGLVADADGNLYGTTYQGGAYDASRYTNDGTVFELAAAALPTFSPDPGTYFAPQKVTISSTTTNAVIYYTTDGTTPTTASTKYTSPIEVSASETIKAFAAAAGNPNGAVVTAAYTILPPPVAPTVSVTPSASGITTVQALTVTVAVTGPSGDPTPTGSVTLTSGTYTSAAVKLSSGSATILIPAGSLGAGAGSVGFGTDTLTVSYIPDSASSLDYLDATGTGSVTVTKLFPTVALTLSASSITTEQALTVTVKVSGGAGNPTPTGSVVLDCCLQSAVKPRSGRAAIAANSATPPSFSYTSATVTLVDGSATITIPANSLPAGSDPLSVYYAPDSASSQIYSEWAGYSSVTVTKVTPTVGLTLSAKSVTTRQPLTVTVAVNGGSGSTTPTGSVILTGGSYTSAAITLSNGSAAITVPAGSLAVGSDPLTVTYTPDSISSPSYNAATGTGSVTVSKVTPTVALTLSATSITAKQALTVTVAVNGGTGNPAPTGSVTLASGAYTSAAVTLSSGSATISIPAGTLPLGSDTLLVSYTPDSASSPSYSSATGTASETVTNLIIPSIAVTASAKSITTKQALTVTVAVNGGSGNATPTGSVTLTSGAYTSAAATLASGSATISIPIGSLAVGSDTLTVSYTPDSASSSVYSTASGSSSVTVTTPIAPAVTVTPSASVISTVQGLTVTVAVNGGSGNATPTGSVTLTSGAYTSAAATLASSGATISIPAGSLAVGSDTLSVSYTPDSASSPIYLSAAGTASETVNKATPTLTVTPSANTVTVAQALTVTVAVGGGSGNATPTGSVQLSGGGFTSATATLSSGSATFIIPANSLSVGTDTLTVSYSGDSVYAASSGTASEKVTSLLVPTVKATAALASIDTADTLSVTATVTGPGATPTGTVKLSGGGYTSASQTLSGGSVTFTIPANSLTVGADTLTVSYSGDTNYTTGSGTASVTVTPAPLTPTVTVTPATATVDSGSTLSVTAAVTGSGVTPTGSVTLSGGGYTSASQTLSSGSATFAIPANSLSAGTDTLTVTYSGDSVYAAGSGTAAVTVTQSVFTLAASTPAAVSPGTVATSTLTVSSSTGYAGSVSLACTLTSSPTGATDLPTCSSGSSGVTLSGATTSGTATITVSSTAAPAATAYRDAGGPGRGWASAGGAVLAFILFLGIPARKRNWRSMLGALILIAALGSLTACGGHSKSSANTGTTAGTYTFTVTATGSPSVSPTPTTTFTVTIN